MKKRNSPQNRLIAILDSLITEHCGGSQAKFAKEFAGCSRSQVSRIMLGQQKISKEILGCIASDKRVDEEELLSAWKSAYENSLFEVPIASGLLSKHPQKSSKLLSNLKVEVPGGFYSPSIYGIRSKDAHGIRISTFEDDDLLFFDTAVSGFKKHLDLLNQKLVAFRLPGTESSVRLARLSVKYKDRKFVLLTTSEPAGGSDVDTKSNLVEGRELRRITLRDRNNSKTGFNPDHRDQNLTEQKVSGTKIEFNQIVGVMRLLMRGV